MELTVTPLVALGSVSSRGASDAAHFIAQQAERARDRLQSSFSLGSENRAVFEELFTVAEDHREPNWDGYGASGVEDETYKQAYRFLESFPLGTPSPTLGVEPDGHLTFEWHHSLRRTLSVSVSPEGNLHYSALLGPNKVYGTEFFSGEFPWRILDLVRAVQTA